MVTAIIAENTLLGRGMMRPADFRRRHGLTGAMAREGKPCDVNSCPLRQDLAALAEQRVGLGALVFQ